MMGQRVALVTGSALVVLGVGSPAISNLSTQRRWDWCSADNTFNGQPNSLPSYENLQLYATASEKRNVV